MQWLTSQAVAQMISFIESVDHFVDQDTKKALTEVNQNSVRA